MMCFGAVMASSYVISSAVFLVDLCCIFILAKTILKEQILTVHIIGLICIIVGIIISCLSVRSKYIQ